MTTINSESQVEAHNKVEPLCPVFGVCGGCAYQDIPYEEEIRIKEEGLRLLLLEKLGLPEAVFEPLLVSPVPYHSRSRLDLTLRRIKSGETFLGFMPPGCKRVVPVNACAIARKEISEFIPELHKQAVLKLPANYRTANLVVKTGDDGRVLWGGIGRHSLRLDPKDYFWTEIRGKRVFYSLDTFFQANLAILPALMDKIESWVTLDQDTVFLDLYAGIGLFGYAFAGQVHKAVLIEECGPSVKLAYFNKEYHNNANVEIRLGKVEDELPHVLGREKQARLVAIIDPPRRGLSESAIETLARAKALQSLLYLSCHQESLVRDLIILAGCGWKVQKVVPLDFFPKTKHLETLVLLCPEDKGSQ